MSGGIKGYSPPKDASDTDYLSAIMEAEAGVKPEAERARVGNAVLNRAYSEDPGAYGKSRLGYGMDTVKGQVTAYSGRNPQFSAWDPQVAAKEASRYGGRALGGTPPSTQTFRDVLAGKPPDPARAARTREIAEALMNPTHPQHQAWRGEYNIGDYYVGNYVNGSWPQRQAERHGWPSTTFEDGQTHITSPNSATGLQALGPNDSPGDYGKGRSTNTSGVRAEGGFAALDGDSPGDYGKAGMPQGAGPPETLGIGPHSFGLDAGGWGAVSAGGLQDDGLGWRDFSRDFGQQPAGPGFGDFGADPIGGGSGASWGGSDGWGGYGADYDSSALDGFSFDGGGSVYSGGGSAYSDPGNRGEAPGNAPASDGSAYSDPGERGENDDDNGGYGGGY